MSQSYSVDLFAGAGGFSAGLLQANQLLNRSTELLAVNHWHKAIDTHKLNHPDVRHLCANLDNVDPRKVIKNGRLEILLASPECTHHSRARGGKPMSDQSRASAWHVTQWAEALRVQNVLVENVKEFEQWGPLDAKGRPIAHRKGELFRAWMNCLEAMGYYVDRRVLNSAHYGAATARERLFIQATRRRKPRWPEKTHYDPSKNRNLFDGETPFRAAREVIDWDLEGNSIFGRKKPLADKTIARIMAGLKKFGGVEFVLGQQSCAAPRTLDKPLPTIATDGAISFVQPFLVVLRNNADGRSLDKPMPALCAGGGHMGICEPFLVRFQGGARWERSYLTDSPIGTLDTSNRYGLCEPFIVPVTHGSGENRTHDINKPMPTITCAKRGEMALIEPFILPVEGYYRGNPPRSLDKPLTTITQRGGGALVEPYLVPYYGNSTAADCDRPLPTVTTKDTFGLCEPEPVATFERDGVTYALLDIRFRMLQPHELAAAMGMDGYQFEGTKADKTKMIGNAVEVNTARALCKAVLQ